MCVARRRLLNNIPYLHVPTRLYLHKYVSGVVGYYSVAYQVPHLPYLSIARAWRFVRLKSMMSGRYM